MKKRTFKHRGESAHWFEIEGAGPCLHFNHANGYPFGTYRQFLKGLSPHFHIIGLSHRATWENIGTPPPKMTWMDYADDLIHFLEETGKTPVIGAGHSLGGIVTLLAARKRPDLFSKVVLIESTLMAPWLWAVFRSLPLSLKHQVPLIQKTLHRPDCWPSQDECIDFHRNKPAFQRFTEKSLHDFAAYGLISNNGDGQRLWFPKAWEAHIYCTVPFVWDVLNAVKLPILAIRGRLSDVVSKFSWNLWRLFTPDATFVEFSEAGHLAPFEMPEEVAEVVVDWCLSANG